MRRLTSVMIAAGLTLAACDRQATAPATSVPTAIPDAANTATAAPDPLSAEALAAQGKLLDAAAQGDREEATRAQLDNRVLAAFRQAVEDLKASGVKFEPVEQALSDFNFHRRELGLDNLNVIFQDPEDAFAIVNADFGGPDDAFAIVYLSGTQSAQAFGPTIPAPILGADGKIPASCTVSIPGLRPATEPHSWYSTETHYLCRAVMAGEVDAKIVADAKRYLTVSMY